jgi:hypothetical protein
MIDGTPERPTPPGRIKHWYHVHTGPPYVCHGGAERADLVEDLAAVIQDGWSDGAPTVTVLSLDAPTVCAYRQPWSVVLIGRVSEP